MVTLPSEETPITPSLRSLSSTSTRSRSYSTWAKALRSLSAITLKVSASCPISSSTVSGTLAERSPPAMSSALRSMRFSRRAMKYEAM